MVARVVLAFAAGVASSAAVAHALRRHDNVTEEPSTSYGSANTATAVEVQGAHTKAILIETNGEAAKPGLLEEPQGNWLKPLSAAMLTCCALAAGTLSHELQSGRHDWLRIYLSVASLLVAALAVLQLLRLGQPPPAPSNAPETAPALRVVLPDFSGVWIKDKNASDTLDGAMELVKLNMLLRRAVGLVKGMEIVQSADQFEFSVTSVIPWFKVMERYPLSGETREFKRRDLRRGRHVGRARPCLDGTLRVEVRWPEPYGGEGADTFRLLSPSTLSVASHMLVHGRSAGYTTIYRRKA